MSNKIYYKLELVYVKYSPVIISLGLLLNNILAYFNIYIEVLNGYVLGVSLITVGHLYISSKAYRFCKYHRMFIHYIVVNNCTNMLDYYIGIPIGDKSLALMYIIIAGIFAYLTLYYHKKYGGRGREKENE